MKSVLVTGGAGFIGSNFIKLMLKRHTDWAVVNADVLTYAGSLENLREVSGGENLTFVKCDITDAKCMRSLFQEYDFDYVVNFAAESHVDRSINEPGIFVRTNVLGAQCLLDCARQSWQTGIDGHGYPVYKRGVKFLQVSTDEVYGPSRGEPFDERSPLFPGNPYAASKAAADVLAGSYAVTYKLPVCITRSTNNYGPCQHYEKLIPLAIRCALKDERIPVYGDGLQQRDWLHVYDNCDAIEAVLMRGKPGEIYNIGSGVQRTNVEVVAMILKALEKPVSLITHVRDRLGHDRRYGIDTSKITRELGWKPEYSFEQGIRDTVEWYVSNEGRQ